jgi:hypothetical protein
MRIKEESMSHTYQYAVEGIMAAAMVLTVIYLVSRRRSAETTERGLLLKMIGFTLLGAFTFTLNGFPLPLGFIFYLLIFNRPSRDNRALKHTAAKAGLLLFCLSAVIGFLPDHLTRFRTIEFPATGSNIESLELMEAWKTIDKHNEGELRLDRFDLEYGDDGTIRRLRMELFNERAIPHVNIQLDPDGNVYTMRIPVIYPKSLAAADRYADSVRRDYGQEHIETPRFLSQLNALLRSELPDIARQQQTTSSPAYWGLAAEGRLEGGLGLREPVYRMDGDRVVRMTKEELVNIKHHRSIRMYGMVLGPMIDHGDESSSQSGQGEGTVYFLYDTVYTSNREQ